MIVGHSLGGGAAIAMAAESAGRASRSNWWRRSIRRRVGGFFNVHRSVIIRPRGGEDHFSVIAAHDRDLTNYVLGEQRSRKYHHVGRRIHKRG